ncbi:MAG: hypothetical protein ACRDGM_04315 [bacterium]
MSRILLLFVGGGEGTPPDYYSGEIGEQEDTIVVVIFNEPIVSALDDYAAGVTIKADSVTQAISAAVRQGDSQTVFYTIPQVAGTSVVTWQYSDALGDIADLAGNQLGDVTAQTALNTINTRWWFNRAQDSSHILTCGL